MSDTRPELRKTSVELEQSVQRFTQDPRDELEALALSIDENPEVIIPHTGELVDVRDIPSVARVAVDIKNLEKDLERFRKSFEAVLRLEARRQGTKTLHVDDLTITISGGPEEDFDIELLREELEAAGLPPWRLGEVIRVSYRVDKKVANQLESSSNPLYAQAVSRAKTLRDAAWRVAIVRKGRR